VGHFLQKKIWNVASGRHEPFSICQLSVLIPAGYHKGIGAGFCARVSNLVFLRSLRSLGLYLYTSILHNNLNTEIHLKSQHMTHEFKLMNVQLPYELPCKISC
jgi:hypothetical protein